MQFHLIVVSIFLKNVCEWTWRYLQPIARKKDFICPIVKQHKWALKNCSANKFSKTKKFSIFMFFYLCLPLYFLRYCLLFLTFWTVIFMLNSIWWRFLDTAPLNTGSFNLIECWVVGVKKNLFESEWRIDYALAFIVLWWERPDKV